MYTKLKELKNLLKGIQMENKQKKGFFVMSFFKLLAVFIILTMVGCGDGGGGGEDGVSIGNMVLTSELGDDESLPQWGTTTITANAARVDDGTDVLFSATGGRIDSTKMNNDVATTTF